MYIKKWQKVNNGWCRLGGTCFGMAVSLKLLYLFVFFGSKVFLSPFPKHHLWVRPFVSLYILSLSSLMASEPRAARSGSLLFSVILHSAFFCYCIWITVSSLQVTPADWICWLTCLDTSFQAYFSVAGRLVSSEPQFCLWATSSHPVCRLVPPSASLG